MKKYTLIIAGILLTVITVSFLWFSYNHQRQIRVSLNTTLQVIIAGGSIDDYQNFVDNIEGVRVSIIDESGKLLADNRIDKNTASNYTGRPEFIAARSGGYGEAVRISHNTGKKSIYVITKLSDGIYVRAAQPVSLTNEFLLWLFMPVLLLSACLTVLMIIFARSRQLEKMRQEFVANVSHELKTPLTSIKGFAELTAAGLVNGVEAVKNYQTRIISQSDRLLTIINDIMHLSKLEGDRPKNLVSVNTRSAAEQVRETLKFSADKKNIIIQVSGEGKVTAETEPIYHMIYNLVDNSINYGKRGGFVKIILDGKKITVADDGIGIPQNDIERVFERFYRVDKSRSTETGGTGLGLAIVKHTVQKYNGAVTLKSENGTQVYVEFLK
ncbi:MAG: GHKL domain-containing protein [Chitinispirillales bacterium]|jgi:two-component system phosphate regulon sensor histidine kinase PhoR|nr:GHKL domain-containing protein [Chitinispirillales bacterium]